MEQNNYKIIVSDRANQMMVSHAVFLSQVSEDAAIQLTKSFVAAVNSLSNFPQRCPWLSGEFIPRNAYRYLIFDKRYLIIFQIKDDTVLVEYVVDCRQDYGWLIR